MPSYRRRHFTQLDSTNDEARRLIDSEEAFHGLLITTDFQTKGRGQFGRTWQSDQAQNAMMSIILRPTTLEVKDQYLLNLMTSLAVADVIKDYDLKVFVKWPNDIYVSDKKICGILIQNYLQGSTLQHTIIGIGLNTNQLEWTDDIPNATSLAKELGQPLDINDVVDLIALSVMKKYALINDADLLIQDYHQLLYKKGTSCLFQVGETRIVGVIQGVDKRGCLLVQQGEELKAYQHGEIKLLTK